MTELTIFKDDAEMEDESLLIKSAVNIKIQKLIKNITKKEYSLAGKLNNFKCKEMKDFVFDVKFYHQ